MVTQVTPAIRDDFIELGSLQALNKNSLTGHTTKRTNPFTLI
jgi:hypothetical protein